LVGFVVSMRVRMRSKGRLRTDMLLRWLHHTVHRQQRQHE
jgi:hypothetical protein